MELVSIDKQHPAIDADLVPAPLADVLRQCLAHLQADRPPAKTVARLLDQLVRLFINKIKFYFRT